LLQNIHPMRRNHHRLAQVTGLAVFSGLVAVTSWAGSLAGAYIDPRYQTAIWFGAFSHYIQPWRGYLETVPAGVYTNAIGINFISSDSFTQCDLVAHMLAKNGIRRARVEYGWGGINYDDESRLNGASGFAAKLRALQKHGIRPLILLNCHQGVPCPVRFFNSTVLGNWPVGSTVMAFTSTNGFVLGRTGPRDLTDYWAAEVLIIGITNVGGTNLCLLSKPLPKAFTNGQSIGMATLKYRPFSAPGSPDYLETIAGWQRYVGTVARFAAETLGTTWAEDKGFDMEIYNELTFGTHFLYINDYYEPDLTNYNGSSIWSNLPRATGDYALSNAALFGGVTFCDGFANTIPWPASSTEHPRIGALSKHPYPGPKTFSGTNQPGGTAINALLGQENRTNFQPTYTIAFIDYPTTALQTETLIRDMSPITTDIYGTRHGRYARVLDGKVLPVYCWMTETGTAPNEWGITNAADGWHLKAKAALRLFPIFINKGVTALYWFNTGAAGSGNDDLWLGACYDSFLEYARTNSVYPANDEPFTSPWLKVVGRVSARIGAGLDPAFATNVAPAGGVTRPLTVESISDTHDHFQFAGDGSAAHPHLFNRELLAILPFQANPSRFVIAYYVQTRDMRTNLPPEDYTVLLRGLNLSNATVSVYDPMGDTNAPVSVTPLDRSRATFQLSATDYARLLIVEEAAVPAPNRLRAEAGNGRVALSWPPVSLATAYQVYRSTVSGGPYTLLAGGLTNLWWLDTNVVNGTTYYYVVSARAAGRAESANSPEASATPSVTSSRLVPAGSVWKYLDDGSNQGTAWRALDFNDAAWPSGPARLGYGGDGEATIVGYGPDPNNKYITTYFRHRFTVADPAVFTNLVARLQRDDGAVVYLNGTEVWRQNMPAGTITYTTLASATVSGADETAWLTTNLPPGLLRAGTNVAAAEVHQVNATSSDLGFDFELLAAARFSAPLILQSPESVTVVAGQAVRLSVVADSPVPASCQWFRDGQPLAGATNATLAIASAGAADAGLYTVEVRNPAGAATSAEALLQVLLPPVITVQPQSQGVDAGATVTLSAEVAGSLPLLWQWRWHGTNLPGANAPVLTLSNFSAALAGPYHVIVSNAAGSATSAVANLVLNSYVTNSTLLVAAGSVWRYLDDGSDQGTAWRDPGFNDAAWLSGPAKFGYGDTQTTVLRRTNSAGRTNVTFYFRRAFVVADPTAFHALAFRVLRDDGVVVYLNGTELFRQNMPEGPIDHLTLASSAVSGADETNFFPTTTAATALVQGTNLLAVELHQQALTSSDVGFDLELRAQQILLKPAVLAGPESLVRYAGESARLNVEAIGSAPLFYQWRLRGTNLAGATNASLFLPTLALADAGAYSVVVSNAAGVTVSAPAILTVLPWPAARIERGLDRVTLSWPAVAGRVYTVLASTNLVDWAELTNLVAIGPTLSFADVAVLSFPQRFFQLRLEPAGGLPSPN
jgi:hypothetical protein